MPSIKPTKPLRRRPVLIRPSRDRHRSPSLCVRLLHTPAESHRAELRPHFPGLLERLLEEEALFTPYRPRIDNALRERSGTNHAKLRTMVTAPEYISKTQNKDFATTSCDHARSEERELFPAVGAYLDTLK